LQPSLLHRGALVPSAALISHLAYTLISRTPLAAAVLVPPIVAFVAWILFVTDEIGHTIEDPFGKGLVTNPDEVGSSYMTEANIEELFNKMDTNNNGVIGLEDLQKSLREMAGADLGDDEAEQVMARLDLNGDGIIDIEEFRQSWAFTTGGRRSEIKQLETLPLGQYCDTIQGEVLYHWRLKQLCWSDDKEGPRFGEVLVKDMEDQGGEIRRQVFDNIDEDGSGQISRQELSDRLVERGFTSYESDSMFEQLDTNRDGLKALSSYH